MQYDVFNGDADGIFALHQHRLATPCPNSKLITGVKRDINLLSQIEDVTSSLISVFDVSLESNRQALLKMLKNGNRFLYIDHHFAGDIPDSGQLETHIESSAEICTSLIVNHMLSDRYCKWAICGAFGDNLHEAANRLAQKAHMSEEQIAILQEIGELFNYNGYGSKLEDLHFHPAELFRAIMNFEDPLVFHEKTNVIKDLKNGYENDLTKALNQDDIALKSQNRVYRFPAVPWARRMAGVFSNLKAREKAEAAHAIIVENDDGTLQISVRAPLLARKNADTLCRQFPTGGGRAAAAGINNLPLDMYDDFLDAFHHLYS